MHQIESHKYYETMSTGIRNGPNQKNQCENSTIQSKINVIGYIFTHAHTHTHSFAPSYRTTIDVWKIFKKREYKKAEKRTVERSKPSKRNGKREKKRKKHTTKFIDVLASIFQ